MGDPNSVIMTRISERIINTDGDTVGFYDPSKRCITGKYATATFGGA